MSKLISHKKNVLAKIRAHHISALHKTGETIEQSVNILAPVDTGILRGSYSHQVDTVNLVVQNGTNI